MMAALVSAGAAASTGWAQGSLTPPGAPAPTMKTLAQVAPRTPITNAGYVISQPGSYYLTTNLTATGHGVRIATNAVTLDLMGFTLTGDGGGADNGVFLDGATNASIRDVVVRNGVIRNFGYGVNAEYIQGSRLEHLIAASNSNYGVFLYGGNGQCNGNTIADCTIRGSGLHGVYLNGSSGGQCDGNTIARCAVSGNGFNGVYLSGSFGQCDGNAIANCAVRGNGSMGVVFIGDSGQCDGNTVDNCAISGNANYGVLFDGQFGRCNGNSIVACTISGSGAQGLLLNGNNGECNGNTIADCAISGNGSSGVYLSGSSGQCGGNTVANCAVSGNSDTGVWLTGGSGQCEGNSIVNCAVRRNRTRGILLDFAVGNRVEGNHVSGQTGSPSYGIACLATAGNLIFRNTCVGQTNNFTMLASDTYGPIVTNTGALVTTNGAAALSPWANFSR